MQGVFSQKFHLPRSKVAAHQRHLENSPKQGEFCVFFTSETEVLTGRILCILLFLKQECSDLAEKKAPKSRPGGLLGSKRFFTWS